MSFHFSMGARNKITNEYEYPKIAKKGIQYKCPECDKDVNFCKGKIKQPYFAHKKSDSPCYYYDKPSESQIHKDAKYLLHNLLTKKTPMDFYNICRQCNEKIHGCCELINYESNMEPIKDNKIVYIFEICYKNKTRENNRPEPWVEIKAEDFIRNINNSSLLNDKGILEIECIRDSICDVCELEEEKDRKYWQEWHKQCELERKQFETWKKQQEKKIELKKTEAQKCDELVLIYKKKYILKKGK